MFSTYPGVTNYTWRCAVIHSDHTQKTTTTVTTLIISPRLHISTAPHPAIPFIPWSTSRDNPYPPYVINHMITRYASSQKIKHSSQSYGQQQSCRLHLWFSFACWTRVVWDKTRLRRQMRSISQFEGGCSRQSVSTYITLHLFLSHEGRWGTTDDFTTSFLLFFSVLHCP